MKSQKLKQILLIITCFSLILVMAACGQNNSDNGDKAHKTKDVDKPSSSDSASTAVSPPDVSTDPNNPTSLTFFKTAADGRFYQTIYDSSVDDPDMTASPGVIYGCYHGVLEGGAGITFIVCKPRLSPPISDALWKNDLNYFVVQEKHDENIDLDNYGEIYIFRNKTSFDVVSPDKKFIRSYNRCPGISIGSKNDIVDSGSGVLSEGWTVFSEVDEDYILENIEYLITH
ncbi:hypothetical protein HMPREF1635_02515 [Clostridiales bacterium S5-A14a]|nr:hypothetical protein HMPREF1635_02515 [Clostridiales bacterium S5-A14a]